VLFRDRLRAGKVRYAVAALGLSAALGATLVPTSPASAEPSVGDVAKRVDRLYHEAEVAQERWHDANLQLSEIKHDLAALRADQARQDQRLEAARSEVEDSIVNQYEGQGLSAVGQVVVSEDPGAFLGRLSTMSAYGDLQDQLFDTYATELKALDIRRSATQKRAAEAAAVEKEMAADKKDVDARLADAKSLLADLKEKQRASLVSRGASPRTVSSIDAPASGSAAVAVRTALAQVGDAYVYGAAGPSAFDCSGLTMYAWGAAGVGLPHSSSAQFGSGPRIAASDLQPGDLVFYYSPISHVGMYIGNGMIVHAAHPGAGVMVSGLYSMPFSGAVRPG
jgi:cell wall-associated NlpC family hydrolase